VQHKEAERIVRKECPEISVGNLSSTKKIKVVQMTSIHGPLDARIFHKHSKSLAGAGYEVVVVAPELALAHDDDEPRLGVTIRTVPRAGSRVERLRKTIWDVYHVALAEHADIYHFHDPELIPIGLLLKLHGKRVIYDVHENLPLQILTKPWISPAYRRSIGVSAGRFECMGASCFDGIVAATQEIAERFPAGKTITVQNFPDFTHQQRVPYRDREPLAVYIGAISRIRGIHEMMEAIRKVPAELNARLAIAGPFDSLALERELQNVFSPNVHLLGFQTQVAVADLLAQARIGLVLLHPTPSYLNALPMKLFEYMRAAIPAIVSDFPLWRKIVEHTGCGVLVDPLDPAAIADAISRLLMNPSEAEEMGKRGYEACARSFNWGTEKRKLLRLYADLTT
jgi:glycosyltransferase involved in cell wall biosynthesis